MVISLSLIFCCTSLKINDRFWGLFQFYFFFLELFLSISKEYLVAAEVLLNILLGLFGAENFSLVGSEHYIKPKCNLELPVWCHDGTDERNRGSSFLVRFCSVRRPQGVGKLPWRGDEEEGKTWELGANGGRPNQTKEPLQTDGRKAASNCADSLSHRQLGKKRETRHALNSWFSITCWELGETAFYFFSLWIYKYKSLDWIISKSKRPQEDLEVGS